MFQTYEYYGGKDENYWGNMNGENIGVNPPGDHYGMTFQKIQLLSEEEK